MAARPGARVLTGAALLGVAAACSGVFVRTRPDVDRHEPGPARRPSARPAALERRVPPADDLGESPDVAAAVPAAAEPGRLSVPYGTLLLKSTWTRRHWLVDPREIQAADDLRDGAFQDLSLSAPFGGGLRVEHPGRLRLGVLRDLEAGDVLREVNGVQIRDEPQFRLLAGRLWRKTGVIRVTLDREGSPMVITYQGADTPPPRATFR